MPSHLLTTDFLCTLTLVSYTDFVNKVKKNTIIIHLSTTYYVDITSAVVCCMELCHCLGSFSIPGFLFFFNFNLFVPFDF